jgi:DNA repair protein RecN (Recombination protein N)
VRTHHDRLRDARAARPASTARVRETEQRADFLRFQLEEIDRAKVRPGEEEQLEQEARRLSHAGELAGLADAARRTLRQ